MSTPPTPAPIPEWAHAVAREAFPFYGLEASQQGLAQSIADHHQRATQTLTCVYCGHAYPPGTPSHGSNVLTAHIKVCPSHPMRALEEENTRLEAELKRFKAQPQEISPSKVVEDLQVLGWNRELREQVTRLRAALVGLVGVDTPEELAAMKGFIQKHAPEGEQQGIVAAIDALLEVRPSS